MNFSINQQLDIIKFLSNNTINRSSSHNLLNESVQEKLSDVVLDKIFALTIGKYNKIDFSEIERSRGDITRIKYYANLRECIDILLDIHSVTDKIPNVLIISTTLNYMLELKNQFEHIFRLKNNIGIMIYNTIMYIIMEATSYLIATSIDFVKGEDEGVYDVNIYTDSKQSMLIDQLNRFNSIIEDGSLLKFIGESEKAVESMQEAGILDTFISKGANAASNLISKGIGVVKDHPKTTITILATASIFWLASFIIPLVRESIYLIYRLRQKIADAAELQAEFLEANIEILKRESGEDVEKIISKQEKYVKRFKSIASVFSIENDKAERDIDKEIKDEKIDVSAVVI